MKTWRQRIARRKGTRRRQRQRKIPRTWALSTIAVAALIFLIFVSGRASIFTLDGVTERVSVELTDSILSEWRLPRARLMVDPLKESSEAIALRDAVLLPEAGTTVQIQRHGVGVARLQLTIDEGRSVGRIIAEGESERSLGDWAVLIVELEERPLMLPFRGVLVAGDDVAIGVDSILLSGRISVVEAQLIGETHYLAGEQVLDAGDRVRFLEDRSGAAWGAEDWGHAVVDGFVRAESADFSEAANALSVVAHGRADHVRVERLGSAGYRIRAPFWARFLHDPLIAGFTTILALLLLVFEASLKMHELFGFEAAGQDTGLLDGAGDEGGRSDPDADDGVRDVAAGDGDEDQDGDEAERGRRGR